MTLVWKCSGLLLIAFGVACLLWVGLGRLLLPCACSVRASVMGQGDGEGLEQTVKGLLWLRRTGLWHGVIIIENGGLNPEGMALAETLARQDGVELR